MPDTELTIRKIYLKHGLGLFQTSHEYQEKEKNEQKTNENISWYPFIYFFKLFSTSFNLKSLSKEKIFIKKRFFRKFSDSLQ